MASDDRLRWVHQWRDASPRLEAIRADELRRVDVAAFIESMTGAFRAASRNGRPRQTSGLVIQQRLFSQLAK